MNVITVSFVIKFSTILHLSGKSMEVILYNNKNFPLKCKIVLNFITKLTIMTCSWKSDVYIILY